MKYDREVAAGAVFLIAMYLIHPYYEKGYPFFGLDKGMWLVMPVLLALLVYYLWKKKTLWESLRNIASKEEAKELEDPMTVIERFENSRERSIIPGSFKVLNYIRSKDDWIFVVNFQGQKRYLILNGLKGRNLNPSLVTRFELKELGYNDIKDYKRSGKSRMLYDLINLGATVEDLSRLGSDIE